MTYTGRLIEAGGSMGTTGYGFSGQQLENKGSFMTVAKSVLQLEAGVDFIEFRAPHRKKKSFGDSFYTGVGSKTIAPGGGSLFLTYGKMHPYKVKLLSGESIRSNSLGGVDTGMQLGEGIVAVVTATGATGLTAAALSGITLGAGVAVVILAVSAEAVKNHRANLKTNQVFVRVSKTLKGSQLNGLFPYEEKIYHTEAVEGGITYAQIRQKLSQWA